jgi:hypothetical protein
VKILTVNNDVVTQVTAVVKSQGSSSGGAIPALDSNGRLDFSVMAIGTAAGSNGTVSQIDTGPGLEGGPIVTTGTISLSATTIASLAHADAAVVTYNDPTDGDVIEYNLINGWVSTKQTRDIYLDGGNF